MYFYRIEWNYNYDSSECWVAHELKYNNAIFGSMCEEVKIREHIGYDVEKIADALVKHFNFIRMDQTAEYVYK